MAKTPKKDVAAEEIADGDRIDFNDPTLPGSEVVARALGYGEQPAPLVDEA